MLTAEINNIIAFSYLDMSNHNKAKFHATVANNVNKGQSIRQAADSYLILSKIAEHEKHYKLALDYFRKFATADKAYLDALKAKSLAFQLAQNKSTPNHITSMALLSGGSSILLGDDSGKVSQWFEVATEQGREFKKIRSFNVSDNEPVVAIYTEQFRKSFYTETPSGEMGMFYTTSEADLWRGKLHQGDAQAFLMLRYHHQFSKTE